jgi:hypothetical protein
VLNGSVHIEILQVYLLVGSVYLLVGSVYLLVGSVYLLVGSDDVRIIFVTLLIACSSSPCS